MIEVISEQALVAQCKSGDHAAFTELVRRSSPVARRAIRAIVPNSADAEDIMQDTLLKAYKGVVCFHGNSKFSTWLTRIAINSALMYLRRRRNRIELSLDCETDEEGSRPFQPVDGRVDPEQGLMRDQAVFIVRQAICALPAQLRQYASRRDLEELTHEQAAASLGISLVAGKSRSLRARRRLALSLGAVFERPA